MKWIILLLLFPAIIFCASGQVAASDEGAVLKALMKAASSIEIFGKKINGALRPYGSVGYTFGNVSADPQARIHGRGGLQGLWIKGKEDIYFGFGIDAGYGYYYHYRNRFQSGHGHFFSSLAVAELNLFIVTFQVGVGPCLDLERRGMPYAGLMVSAGFRIPLKKMGVKYISLSFFIRNDTVFTEKIFSAVSLTPGVTFYFR